jgi:hypothetical protein
MKKVLMALLLISVAEKMIAQNCDTFYTFNSQTGQDLDAQICDFFPSSNLVNDEDLMFDAWTSGGSPFIYRSLLKLDVSSIPSNAIVTSAKLYLYHNPSSLHFTEHSFYAGSAYTLNNSGAIYTINQNWNPSTVTWNNQPTYASSNFVTIPATTTSSQNNVIDVQSLIANMVANPTNSFGLLLKLNTELAYRQQMYCSSNHPNSSLHPKLIVCFQTPLSVNQNILLNNITINAKNGVCSIENAEKINLLSVKICNEIGQEVCNKVLQNNAEINTVDINRLQAGVYIVLISTEKGIIRKKIQL